MTEQEIVWKLKRYSRLLEQLAKKIETKGTKCDCCGRVTYPEFNKRQARDHVEGAARALTRAAGRLLIKHQKADEQPPES